MAAREEAPTRARGATRPPGMNACSGCLLHLTMVGIGFSLLLVHPLLALVYMVVVLFVLERTAAEFMIEGPVSILDILVVQAVVAAAAGIMLACGAPAVGVAITLGFVLVVATSQAIVGRLGMPRFGSAIAGALFLPAAIYGSTSVEVVMDELFGTAFFGAVLGYVTGAMLGLGWSLWHGWLARRKAHATGPPPAPLQAEVDDD